MRKGVLLGRPAVCFFKDAVEAACKQRWPGAALGGSERRVPLPAVSGCIQTSVNMSRKTSVAAGEAADTQQRNGTSACSLSSGSRLNRQKLAAIPVSQEVISGVQLVPTFYCVNKGPTGPQKHHLMQKCAQAGGDGAARIERTPFTSPASKRIKELNIMY